MVVDQEVSLDLILFGGGSRPFVDELRTWTISRVRRGKARVSCGCKSRRATVAPAVAARAVHRGNDMS